VRFDAGASTVLALCTIGGCPWSELVTDAAIARREALEHLWRVHPDAERQQNTLQRWLARRRPAVR
jgi:hypothetical protein